MRAHLVALTPELFDQDLRIDPVVGPLHAEALVAELAVEGFVQTVRFSAAALVQDYARLAEIVEPAPLSDPVSRDPDDDVVLATALAAQALLIVSGDRDLLDLGTFRDIRILNAAEALRALGA